MPFEETPEIAVKLNQALAILNRALRDYETWLHNTLHPSDADRQHRAAQANKALQAVLNAMAEEASHPSTPRRGAADSNPQLDRASCADLTHGGDSLLQLANEGDWDTTFQRLQETLVANGLRYGDNPELMKAKADRIVRILRAMSSFRPLVPVLIGAPRGLTPAQLDIVRNAMGEVSVHGFTVGVMHAMNLLLEASDDLCTSKLSDERVVQA